MSAPGLGLGWHVLYLNKVPLAWFRGGAWPGMSAPGLGLAWHVLSRFYLPVLLKVPENTLKHPDTHIEIPKIS